MTNKIASIAEHSIGEAKARSEHNRQHYFITLNIGEKDIMTIGNARQLALNTASRLADLIQPDGRFLYAYNAATRAEIPEYNILRHAGCIWALNLASESQPLSVNQEALKRKALTWLMRMHLLESRQSGLCLVEDGCIKLGANALAVLAILSFPEQIKYVPGSPSRVRFLPLSSPHRPSVLVEKLCDHMLAQVTPAGDFHHVRFPNDDTVSSFRSEYYTGEALFALLSAFGAYPSLGKLRVARDLVDGLGARDYGVEQQSHWMMYAIETAYILAPDAALLAYADKIAAHILDHPYYRNRQQCTPIACRSEALLAYARMLGRAGHADNRRFAQVRDEIATNLSLQLKNYLPDGVFCRGGGDPTVRIDFLQHNLTAFLGHADLQNAAL